ncbi:hypothetical protein [Actinoplanes sp. ATCC 53533]|uniref:hypothetical protein n=1 Tax=Actinoplanes sp. ATCC 53533 TaxID=1288362 RepID=UPI0013157199|nr:hypothetical protein [Actinoplanes sp. ATCC 53533]
MAFRECTGGLWWSATKRRRVLDRAEREQALESAAARQRLLHLAAQSDAGHGLREAA